jgi:hypothetical protein
MAGDVNHALASTRCTYEILKPEDFGLTRYMSIGYVPFLAIHGS